MTNEETPRPVDMELEDLDELDSLIGEEVEDDDDFEIEEDPEEN